MLLAKAVISARYQDRYQVLYDRQFTRVDSKRKSDEIIRDSVTEQQEAAVQSLLDTRKQPAAMGKWSPYMSGESTEKRSILYVSAKIQQSRIMCDWLEKLDATENNAMFGDDDINFDMQLERFDVDTGL